MATSEVINGSLSHMKRNIRKYQLFEGTIQTEQPVYDRSIQLMIFRDPEMKEYQILINRTLIPEDKTVEDWCAKEQEKLKFKLPGFKEEGKLIKSQIGPAKLEVIQVANHYLNNEGAKIKQIQSIIRLPKHPRYNAEGRCIIIFSLSSEERFTDYQRKHYVQIINSFSPDID